MCSQSCRSGIATRTSASGTSTRILPDLIMPPPITESANGNPAKSGDPDSMSGNDNSNFRHKAARNPAKNPGVTFPSDNTYAASQPFSTKMPLNDNSLFSAILMYVIPTPPPTPPPRPHGPCFILRNGVFRICTSREHYWRCRAGNHGSGVPG